MLAVYRGVAYDTNKDVVREGTYRKVEVTYRGIKHTEIILVKEVQK